MFGIVILRRSRYDQLLQKEKRLETMKPMAEERSRICEQVIDTLRNANFKLALENESLKREIMNKQ